VQVAGQHTREYINQDDGLRKPDLTL